MHGRVSVVKYLLELGMDIDGRGRMSTKSEKHAANDNGRTPLMQATAHNQLDTVKYLCSKGANVDARDFVSTKQQYTHKYMFAYLCVFMNISVFA